METKYTAETKGGSAIIHLAGCGCHAQGAVKPLTASNVYEAEDELADDETEISVSFCVPDEAR